MHETEHITPATIESIKSYIRTHTPEQRDYTYLILTLITTIESQHESIERLKQRIRILETSP